MKRLTNKERWNAAIPKMKKAYPKLTDEDLNYVTGSEHNMLINLAEKTGLTQDQLEEWLDTL